MLCYIPAILSIIEYLPSDFASLSVPTLRYTSFVTWWHLFSLWKLTFGGMLSRGKLARFATSHRRSIYLHSPKTCSVANDSEVRSSQRSEYFRTPESNPVSNPLWMVSQMPSNSINLVFAGWKWGSSNDISDVVGDRTSLVDKPILLWTEMQ